MATSPQLNADVIYDILTFLPDFHTLSAALRTCKFFYAVFQDRRDAILRAILSHSIHDAERLAAVRAEHWHKRPCPWGVDGGEEKEYATEPLTRRSADNLVKRGRVASELEIHFARSHPTTPSDRLEPEARDRFHRALHRYWLLRSAPDNVLAHEAEVAARNGPNISREAHEAQWELTCLFLEDAFLLVAEFATDELFELLCVADFCTMVVKKAYERQGGLYDPDVSLASMLHVYPDQMIELVEGRRRDVTFGQFTDRFLDACTCVLEVQKVDKATWADRRANAILGPPRP